MIESFLVLPQTLAQQPVFSVGLTLAAFLLANLVFRRLGRPVWLPPVLIAAVLLASSVALLALDYADYRQGSAWLTALLGPATVALGVPLSQQVHHIQALWRPILFALPIAATMAAVYAVGIAWALGGSAEVLASLAPKSVTAPIAIGITEQLQGSVPLMMGGLLITGVVATLAVDICAAPLGVSDERLVGLVLGINGHAIGTARAFEISPRAGAFASLGMGLTGIFTALMLPVVFAFQ